jgi:hypothetical protein
MDASIGSWDVGARSPNRGLMSLRGRPNPAVSRQLTEGFVFALLAGFVLPHPGVLQPGFVKINSYSLLATRKDEPGHIRSALPAFYIADSDRWLKSHVLYPRVASASALLLGVRNKKKGSRRVRCPFLIRPPSQLLVTRPAVP